MNQLSQILPLDNESLQQMLDYTSTLSKDAAAEHLRDILGDSPRALEFISSYNSRPHLSPATSPSPPISSTAVPRSQPKRKIKPPLNKLPAARQVENHGDTAGAYQKGKQEDYVAGNRKTQHQEPALASTLALSDKPDARQLPKSTAGPSLKPPPSASGALISDLPNVRTGSRASSRTSSPAPKTSVNITGGASMHGASTVLQDLDSAIRSLELQTNPSLNTSSNQSSSARACSCNATRHPLLTAAPNCLNCGKIICVKEGLGPCTFCHTPLLSSAEITSMIDSLKQERGQERMVANNANHRRADISAAPRSFTPPRVDNTVSASIAGAGGAPHKNLDLAEQHRDRLLTYQAENARRTQIHDEAADYETPASGLSQWSSPVERANQLKRQQKVLREQEWNAKPEYEKRRVVVSVDLIGGKVVKKMGNVERNSSQVDETATAAEDATGEMLSAGVADGPTGGTFSRNPLMGNLIRPVWKAKDERKDKEEGKGKGQASDTGADADADKENAPRQSSTWRRVQDDADDNEAMILDGGIYGDQETDRGARLGVGEEPDDG